MFDKIISFQNLLNGYKEARRLKRYKNYVLDFSRHLECNILKLRNELKSNNYKVSGYREFVIYEPKRREIKAPSFRDRVIHHSLYKVIEPFFEKGFIFDSYACRKNKGTHRAVKRLQKFLHSIKTYNNQFLKGHNNIYCLKCDISKYFASVNHNVLLRLVSKKIKCKKTLNLIRTIIESNNSKQGKGVPIGNLTSQLFANIYLNELDQYAKHFLKEKYYIRYMDDFIFLSLDKNHLHNIKNKLAVFLNNDLKLKFNPKKNRIFPANKGIDFLGYVIFDSFILIRKSTLKRWKKKFKNKNSVELMASWNGYTKIANSYRITNKIKNKLILLC